MNQDVLTWQQIGGTWYLGTLSHGIVRNPVAEVSPLDEAPWLGWSVLVRRNGSVLRCNEPDFFDAIAAAERTLWG